MADEQTLKEKTAKGLFGGSQQRHAAVVEPAVWNMSGPYIVSR